MIQFRLDTDRQLFEDALDFGRKQIRALVKKHPSFYPMYTQKGKWKHPGAAWTHWCDGFMPGVMWIFHKRTEGREAEFWKKAAIQYTKPLEPRKMDREVHDLGFVFLSTYYRWYQIDKDPQLNEVLIQAGRTLALRFQEKGQYLRSFVGPESLFIDIMMNVGILFYAARETRDTRLREIALRHAYTTRRYMIRGDGSTAHEGIFDTRTGEFLKQTTHQGFRGDSCWSRGLTWALYGFTTCYEYSGDPHFLETAERCADYFIAHTNSDGVPTWDFQAPNDSRKYTDTSAAAIAAAGLLRLCRFVQDPVKGHFYYATAERILRTLCEKHLGNKTKGWEGILKGGIYHLHKNLGVNESVMWGEYFFCEALDRILRNPTSRPLVH